MMKSNNGYWWRILALSILVRLHVSSIALRFVRNAHIDCRNGILISHKNIYPVIGLSGNYSIMPTNECTQIGDAYSYMIQIYRKFDSCGIQVHDKSFVVYVHFGVQNSTHGIMWLVHDQVICPQNAVPPLSTAIMDVREQVFMEKMNEPVYSYRVSTFTPSLMSNQSRMYLRFCMAYENDHDYHFVSIGNCIAAGEHVILTRSMFNETTFHMNSSTEINRIVCRLALTEYNGNYSSFMKYCGPHKAFEMEMLAFEDPTYDAGLTIDCKRTGNRIWSTCTAKSNTALLSSFC